MQLSAERGARPLSTLSTSPLHLPGPQLLHLFIKMAVSNDRFCLYLDDICEQTIKKFQKDFEDYEDLEVRAAQRLRVLDSLGKWKHAMKVTFHPGRPLLANAGENMRLWRIIEYELLTVAAHRLDVRTNRQPSLIAPSY